MRQPAQAIHRQRKLIASDLPQLRALADAVAAPCVLTLPQWTSWYAVVLEYAPDLIIELGRGKGNSTALFTQAAHRLGNTRVFSFCWDDDWDRETRPRLRAMPGEAWFEPLSASMLDITSVDFTHLILPAKRIPLLWDAHGFVVADKVLSHIMPLLALKEHIVICHDVTDNRVSQGNARSYEGKTFWRGLDAYDDPARGSARTNLFWLNTAVDQFISILDFCWRNGIEPRSADWETKEDLVEHADLLAEVKSDIPEDGFSETAFWAYFSLNDGPGPHTFPRSFLGGVEKDVEHGRRDASEFS